MVIHRVKIKDIDEAFLKKLRAELSSEEEEVAIWVPEKPDESALPEDAFWSIIARLDWTREGDDEAILEPAIQHLSSLSEAANIAFDDFLSEKLYRLDGQPYAENAGENAYRGPDKPFSADDFLYARCYVVAQGEDFYHQVLENPEQMPEDKTFESLLDLAPKAYRRKTGQSMDHVPAYPIETFSNAEGWNGEGLFEKILSS
jgi:hypothetical protein